MKKTTELVFVPAPGLSHIVSTVEFAKSLIQRDENLAVTVLVIKSPFHSLGASYIAETASSNPLIKFIHLPHLNPPDPTSTKSPENYICLFIEQYKIHVKDVITNNVLSNPNLSLGGLVVDFLCSSMIDVANKLGVPSYMFFTAGNAFLSLFLYLPNHYSLKGSEFTESDPHSIIPGFLNPVPTSVIPSFCFDDGGYRCFLNHGIRMRQTKGIFINTFLEFDKQSFESLALDPQVPPIYTVGPILNLQIQQDKPDSNRDKIIQWLNNQPSASVIFLCFGSFGSFGEAQLAHMATALERSGYRFLWSVRKKLTSQTFRLPGEYADFAEALPEGFLERTKDRGLVCGYAPQLEVLGNEAVGCFVTHCGWNSVLESLWFGKPIVTWPLYAEQQLNAFQLVKEVGLAVGLEIDYRYEKGDEKIVEADVIENAIKTAMDPENPLRKRTKEMSEICRKAIEEGGSSFMSINHFVKDLYLNKL